MRYWYLFIVYSLNEVLLNEVYSLNEVLFLCRALNLNLGSQTRLEGGEVERRSENLL